MKITYKGDYALKAILELALRYDGNGSVLSLNDIAGPADIPENFLEQIFLTLKRGGFVKSKRGVAGGFSLAKDPKDITVGEVVRFIEGPIEPISCVEEHYKGCKDIRNCIFRSVWKDVANAVSIVVDTLTFEELVLRYKERTNNINSIHEYSI